MQEDSIKATLDGKSGSGGDKVLVDADKYVAFKRKLIELSRETDRLALTPMK